MIFKKLVQSVSNWLLPPICVLCSQHTGHPLQICTPCRQDLPLLPLHCIQCGLFLYGTERTYCGACLSKRPPFDFTYALFPYEWPVVTMITKLKFQHQLSYARALGELFTDRIQTCWYAQQSLPDCILPVPLHPQRLQERGFNQAIEIARPVARRLRCPLDSHGIQRIKATAPQSGLSARKRRSNVAQAFAAKRDYRGLHVALLDDVITTGHTIRECSKILKAQGAKRIDVWCCARRG